MKLLILDDEPLARIGIRTIIPWKQKGYQIVGEAGNIETAVNLARRHRPDIVLVDIILPEKSGFELIEQLHEELPNIRFIIVSCVNDVECYKKAISLGVSEYLLKSTITPDELLQVVEKVSEDIRKERVFDETENEEMTHVNRFVVLSTFLNKALKGQISDEQQIRQKLESYGVNSISKSVYIFLLSSGQELMPAGIRADTDEIPVLKLCQEIINDTGSGFIYRNYEDRITGIFFGHDAGNSDQSIEYLCQRIQATVGQMFDVHTAIGVSSCLKNCERLKEGYEQALEALDRQFFKGGRLYYYNREKIEKEELIQKIIAEKENILSNQNLFDTNAIKESIKRITTLLSITVAFSQHQAKMIFLDIIYHLLELSRKANLDIKELLGDCPDPSFFVENVSSIQELKVRTEMLLSTITKELRDIAIDRQSNAVKVIKQYVSDHLQETISLKRLSEQVFLSSNYISRIFRKRTGEALIQYISRAKVDKAKELLLSGQTIPEVTETMGFSSESYFIKMFKKTSGVTPFQYTKKMLAP